MVLLEDWFVLDQSAKLRRQVRGDKSCKKMISRPYALLRRQVWGGGGVVVSKVENPVGHNNSLWKIWADQFINECYLCSCDQKTKLLFWNNTDCQLATTLLRFIANKMAICNPLILQLFILQTACRQVDFFSILLLMVVKKC